MPLPFEFEADNPTALRFPLPQAGRAGRVGDGRTRLRVLPAEQAGPARATGTASRTSPTRCRCWRSATTPAGSRSRSCRGTSRGSTRPASSPPRSRCRRTKCSPCSAPIKCETPARRWPEADRDAAVRRPRLRHPLSRRATGSSRPRPKLPDGRTVPLRCLAFPEHEFYATEILKIVGEAIPVYSQWFGPFPYPQFTVAESYFGWNGNECAGLVMIDERVFGMPHLAAATSSTSSRTRPATSGGTTSSAPTATPRRSWTRGRPCYFTHRLLDLKHGKNNALLDWPQGAGVAAEHQPRELPLRRHVLRHPQRPDAARGAGPAASTGNSSACSPGRTTAARRCSA